jgi:hypothetical protein
VSLSILEYRRNKLPNAYGLNLVIPNFYGWEAFPTLGTLTQWALSPMAAQVPSVTQGLPCAHGVLGTPHGEVRDT